MARRYPVTPAIGHPPALSAIRVLCLCHRRCGGQSPPPGLKAQRPPEMAALPGLGAGRNVGDDAQRPAVHDQDPGPTRSFIFLGSGGHAGGPTELKLTRKSLISMKRRSDPKPPPEPPLCCWILLGLPRQRGSPGTAPHL